MNKLQLASNEVHVSDIRTCVLHPASETHRQLTDEQLAAAGNVVEFIPKMQLVREILERQIMNCVLPVVPA